MEFGIGQYCLQIRCQHVIRLVTPIPIATPFTAIMSGLEKRAAAFNNKKWRLIARFPSYGFA